MLSDQQTIALQNWIRGSLGHAESPSTRHIEDAANALVAMAKTMVVVTEFGASPSASAAVNVAAINAALVAAAVRNGVVVIPPGVYDCDAGDITIPSGVTLEGLGDGVVFLNAHIVAAGSAGSEIAFTAPASKGDTTISIPATGLDNQWLRIASVINANSSDAGIDQLGRVSSQHSYLAEFVKVKTGGASSATLYAPILWPYSNTPGSDTDGSFATSVAFPVTFHEGGRLRRIGIRGKRSAENDIVNLTWCRDFVIEDCTIDANDLTVQNVRMDYCLDCHVRNSRLPGKLTSMPGGSSANQVIIASCTNCTVNDCTLEGGNQTVDVTYVLNDSTYRGGPSVSCGAVGCTAYGVQGGAGGDGFTDHEGSWKPFWINCTAIGAQQCVRIRSRGAVVANCRHVGLGATGAGVLIQEAAVFESDVHDNQLQGSLYGINYDPDTSTTYNAFQALIGRGGCHIHHNAISDTTSNGITIDTAPALATLFGPTVEYNVIRSPGAHGVRIEAYNNGTIVRYNSISDVPATGRGGVSWGLNIKRLHIGPNHIFNVDASSSALRGSSVGSFITDSTTFPGGESDAELTIEPQFTDSTLGNIVRNNSCFVQAQVAGWQPFVAGIGNAAPTLDRSSIGIWLDGEVLKLSRRDSGNLLRVNIAVMTGSGTPESAVTAPVGSLYVRTDGGSGTTLYVKETGTGNTGWVAK
jgi:hypothetical protein